MNGSRSATRRTALEKLAALSVQNSTSHEEGQELEKIYRLKKNHFANTNGLSNGDAVSASSVPMTIRELEVLLALCKAAPLVQTTKDASSLLNQLAPYVPEAHRQALKRTPLFQTSPPWEVLAYQLTNAVLAIGQNHPSLREQALSCIDRTIESLAKTVESATPRVNGVVESDVAERSLPAIQLTVSLLGFLNATADRVTVWSVDQRAALVRKIRNILSDKFLTSLEGALSAVRNVRSSSKAVKEWKRWLRYYASKAGPLGAMLLKQAFMRVVEESVIPLISDTTTIASPALLDTLIVRKPMVDSNPSVAISEPVDEFTDLIVKEISLLEADSDYLQVSSSWQKHLASQVKASSLRSYLCCTLVNGDAGDDEMLMSWLEVIATDIAQMNDDDLARTVLKSLAILSRTSVTIASNLSRTLPHLIVIGELKPQTAALVGECLAVALTQLSQDMVISTLYSLGNILSGSNADRAGLLPLLDGEGNPQDAAAIIKTDDPSQDNALTLVNSDEQESAVVYTAIIQAIVAIAAACRGEQLAALVISLLVQKVGRVGQSVDAKILAELSTVGTCGGPSELLTLLRLYTRMAAEATVQGNETILGAITEGRIRLATSIRKSSPLYGVYLFHTLSVSVSSGDTATGRAVNVDLATQTMTQLIRPLAVLLASDTGSVPEVGDLSVIRALSRDAWFNLVAHGFTLNSTSVKTHAQDLQVMAQNTLRLVDEARVDMPESSIDFNPVLRRGASQANTLEQKQALIAMIPQCEADVRGLAFHDCVFLNTAGLFSAMRARAGDCTAILNYFLENKVKNGPLGTPMLAIAMNTVDIFLAKARSGSHQAFATPHIALQLAVFLEGCCHRITKVQQAAAAAVDLILSQIPSVLCHKVSLFALLELLTLMWKSCLDSEMDEYDWKSTYTSKKGNVTIQLSDNAAHRQSTLNDFYVRCRVWVMKAINVAPLDVKGLLQAYLEDYSDDGAYGQIALGRSFAVEMGAVIPSSDQRLSSLDGQGNVRLTTASDFIAQYTTRQEHRFLEGKSIAEEDWDVVDYNGATQGAVVGASPEIAAEAEALRAMSLRLRKREHVPFTEVQNVLRNAAGVISHSMADRIPLIQELVAIPFALFTKQSIDLGISLWLSVIKKFPALETRVLAEVAAGWETSIKLRKGFFDSTFQHLDPFFIKEEFAPSNWEIINKRQEHARNLIAPHLTLTGFFSSHFNASRLTSAAVERVYLRLVRTTMAAMRNTVDHPLAREVHFQIVLLAMQVLAVTTQLDSAAVWRIKDSILSSGLTWFAQAPRWTFGSNRLHVKAEIKILRDVIASLQDMNTAASTQIRTQISLQPKQELLMQLLQHEISKLAVWITPLSADSKSAASIGPVPNVKDTAFVNLLHTAWTTDPRIAVQLAARFPTSERLHKEVRALLLASPEKAINEPDALFVLLGNGLQSDCKDQLKYLLYWAPINPMSADTYFFPKYESHPYIIQFAMRALESHSIDVTFFYVPQVVQTLRYDSLGYVERFILETAKFSQLFAHQIIWNMKANSYKDDECQEPDSAKPVLDKVMDALINNFSAEDKDFYQREFDFFSKVTGVSGTLKPLIKRPKAEKKAKIEEELRKIEVDVGVYLPSDPEGEVIGIDRKSGKPLQSHAKAPYMATFRVRKEEAEVEHEPGENGELVKHKTTEMWKSTIFKVGDDCRQDVLALQLISAFRGIFNSVGLDVYVFPYRVIATAPGCGIIEVLPNSQSRDMLGRESVNGLYEYFLSKYGSEDSIRFQEARANFVKSMAAYSIISYLLQFKDRHNGNIMVDDSGHILHIDFGFCFDVVPGGVKFERAPFKLNSEMVAIMGGKSDSAPFRAFEELCIKAFLASRQYVEQLVQIVQTMLDSGLPCFKPTTIQHFRERFVLEKTEREAADFVRKLVTVSAGSYSTGVYDYYQLLTNGIPY